MESDKSLNPIVPRIGNKKSLLKMLIPMIEEQKFKTYTEAFFGGGAVFFGLKFNNTQKKVINDLDKSLITVYSIIKKGINEEELKNKCKIKFTLEDARDMDRTAPKTELEILLWILNRQSNTFGATGRGKIYKNTNPYNKLKKIVDYHNKLNLNTKINNKNALEVIVENDSKDTLHFIDPPYENSKKLYKDSNPLLLELKEILKNIKGKFILTMNDSENVREIFKNYFITSVFVKGQNRKNKTIGKDRQEVIITNFKKIKTKGKVINIIRKGKVMNIIRK
jgi:DNA adenine methylase